MFHPVASSFFYLFSRLFSGVGTGCQPNSHSWCGLSANVNLECRSETCCTRLAEIQDAKNRQLRTIAQLCRAISSQLRHVSTIENNLLNSNISPTCAYIIIMVNFGALPAKIGSGVWDTPANFNGFAALLHDTRVVGVSQTLRR